jgi:hypothetical protein
MASPGPGASLGSVETAAMKSSQNHSAARVDRDGFERVDPG